MHTSKKPGAILIIDFTPFYGGGQKFIADMAPALQNPDSQVYVYTASRQLHQQLSGQVESRLLDQTSYLAAGKIRKQLNVFIKRQSIMHVLLNGNKAMYFAPLLQGHKVAYRHTTFQANTGIKKWIAILLLQISSFFVDQVIFLFQAARKELYINKKKAVVIPHGLPPGMTILQKRPHHPLTISHIGRLNKDKGQAFAISALAKAQSALPPFKLQLIGDGDYEQTLKTLAGQLNASFVHFLGFCPDPSPLFAETDILILPSRFEAYPLVIMEAMAYGIPVIATRTGGISEMVDHGKTGFLFDYGDQEHFVNYLHQLMTDTALRSRMAYAAVEAAKKFDFKKNVRLLRQLLV